MKKNILLLLLLCVAGMTNAFAYSFSSVCATGQTLYYNITDYTHHYVAITYPGTSGSYWNGYTKPSGNITLPVSVYYNGFTYTVKAIGNHAFHDCSDLTGNLSIPNTVTTIGDYAFYLCDFTGSLTIGNSVTSIGNYAFFGCCDFTGALTIPNSVTTIGDYAFYDCCRFTGTLTLGNSLTTIGERAFGSCSLASYNNTTGFTGSLTIPNSVTTIGNRAFEGCFSFSGSLTIGNSVTSIGHEAFINCTGFTGSLTISNSVTSIGYGAFDNCTGFTQVYFNATNCADVSTTDEPFRICGGTLNIGSNVQRIPAHIFHGSSFTHLNYNATNCANPSPSAVPFADLGGTLTIGSTVQRIPTYMFCNCTGFTGSLTIPNSVTTIDSYAFKDCTGFTGSLNIGNSVTTIGGYAFYGCTGFTGSLTIPNSVTTIGNSAFKNCSSFTQVKFNAVNCADVTSGAKPFEGCGGTLTIGSTVQRIPAYMFYNCTGFTGSLTIPNSVLTIGNYAFYGNDFTGPLTIGNSVTSIGNYAFFECCLLTGTLTIPNSVTTIGNYAFFDCCRFTGTLTLGNSLTTIGEKAFYSCSLGGYNTTGFTGSLTIPNSVTSIGNNAFEGCFTFSGSLTIGNSVATIGTEAFKGCTGFTSMTAYPETPPTLGTNAFENVPTNIPVYVPCGSLADYQAANGWNAFTNMQRINNNCDLLTYSINDDGVSVTVTGHVDGTAATGQLFIPETTTIDGVTYAVTAIGDYAFNNCRRFTGSLTIPNSVTTIGQRAFQNCVGFTGSLTIPNSVTTIRQEAFQYCVGFTGSLTIGNSVTTIGNSAFWGCNGFRGSLTLGSSLTTIGSQAFYFCIGFTGSLTIPNSVTTIGSDAFNGCSGFTGTLTIGYSVTNINTRAFKDCNNLTAMMVFPETPPTLGSTVFQNVSTTIPVAVPCGSLADYQTANGWSAFTNMQCIPDTLTVYEDGTATCSYVPVYGTYADEYQKCQFIIPAEQLQDMAQSYISGMSFYLSSPASEAWTATFYVEMIEVDESYFSSNYFIPDVYQDGYTVYHGTLDATGSTMDINFSTPYLYGSGNLLVSFRITTPGNFKSATFIGKTVANTASLYAHSSTTTSNNITTGTQSSFLPKTTFTFTPTSSCPRPTHLEANNITAGGATLTWGGALGQYVVEWKKISDTTWNHITLTGNTYPLSSLEPNTNYNVRVRKACSSTSFSNWYTISFTTECGVYSLPYTYGFEEEDEFDCWTMLDCHQNTGRSNATYSIHQGNYGFRFNYSTNPPQYLISPELDCPAGVNVSFYYKNYLDNYPESFQVGYSTTTKSPSAFTWSAEVTAQDEDNWMLYEDTFPVGTKYVAVMLNSYDQYYLYLDDFSFTPVNQWEFPITGGDWHLIASPIAGINPANITNMTAGEYDLYSFSPTATGEEWQNYKSATFTLQSGQGYLYSHGTGITLNFNGEAYNGNGEFTLTYDATDERKCWNLVGNPFPCAATINRDYYILNEEDQTINPTPITDNTPIPACTAVFVKATGTNDTVVFTKVVQ